MKKKTILYITEIFPYSPTSGAKIKSINTIQTLSKKFNIELICFNKDNISKKQNNYIKKFVKTVKVFPLININDPPKDNLPLLIKNYLKLKPYFIYQFYSKKASQYINNLIKIGKPNIIHIDHINMAQYLPAKKNQVWILEEHNIEHLLAWTNFVNFSDLKKTKLYLFIEYLLTYYFEKRTYKKFDHIFTISNFDRKLLKKIFNINNITTQKVVYDTKKNSSNNLKHKIKNNILFVGDITWTPNKLAIQWFVTKIFPLITKKNPKVVFNIVGEIENNFAKELNKNEMIRTHGFIKKIDHFLNEATLFVMPFKAGGGIRIKSLTAMSYSLPIVSTSLGMQGLSGQKNYHYLITNNEAMFAKMCSLIMKNNKIRKLIGNNGFNYLKKNHSSNNNNQYLKNYTNITQ